MHSKSVNDTVQAVENGSDILLDCCLCELCDESEQDALSPIGQLESNPTVESSSDIEVKSDIEPETAKVDWDEILKDIGTLNK